MTKIFFQIFLCILFLISQQLVYSETILDNAQLGQLLKRELDWPNWSLPGPFKNSDLTQDLIYPEFFKGDWKVLSIDLNASDTQKISYLARFQYDVQGRIVGDRAYNTESIGKEVFGDKLLYVKNDPNSLNRQIAIFKDSEYLETKITGRNEEINSDETLWTDELSLQIFHSSATPRINQVETLSHYQYCKNLGIDSDNINPNAICGEQWQAIYKAPGESLRSQASKNNHYRLIFIPARDQFPSDYSLSNLSNEKDFLDQDDH